MIGVAVNESQLDVVTEFFELFKTPWEQAVPGRHYRVVLTTTESSRTFHADVVFIYGSRGFHIDGKVGLTASNVSGLVTLRWRDVQLPIYKGVAIFESTQPDDFLTFDERPVTYRSEVDGQMVYRIGYDLLAEIQFLLTEGQPVKQALTPTVEIHIGVLRHLLRLCHISFLEIPPRPHGYDFMCCLTHDIDFFGIRSHVFDRTMAGFLYRASFGTLLNLIRGHRSLPDACRNWLAVLSLPLVFLRVLPDCWRPFEEYAQVEDPKLSTFFLVPFKGKAGVAPNGSPNHWRETPYGIGDIREHVKAAADADSELALHGIDAWCDTVAGCEESNQLTALTGQKNVGIRMHWLYFDQGSPKTLEAAGFDYDSTCGYNEAVGYRAGTSQSFRPLGCSTLMELPLTIMDSALFSSGRMGLTPVGAMSLCKRIVAQARREGGAIVINWHDRSLAPERLWDRFYQELLLEIRAGGRVWFAKAREAVDWFRWRRSIRFSRIDSSGPDVQITISAPLRTSVGAVVQVSRALPSGVETEVLRIGNNSAVTVGL